MSFTDSKEWCDRIFEGYLEAWGRDFILKAAKLGIINGYTDGSFMPDKEVTYAEAVTIMVRCLGYSNLESVSSEFWYDGYISKMKEIGLNEALKKAGVQEGDTVNIMGYVFEWYE